MKSSNKKYGVVYWRHWWSKLVCIYTCFWSWQSD